MRIKRWAAVGGAVVALAGLGACSDDAGDGTVDAAGVDAPPSEAAPEPTPSPAADDVLRSFSDDFDDDSNGWGFPPDERGSIAVVDGDFVWDLEVFEQRPHLLATTVGEAFDQGRLEMTDVTVTASVTPQRGAAAMGVFCREVPDTDSDFQWYEFVVRDGYAAIRHADSAGNLEPLAETEDAALPLGESATIGASCVEATLTMSLNGAEVLTADVADPLGNGGAGLTAYDAAEDAADQPMKLAWHDFSVEPAT